VKDTRCGILGADARPTWSENPKRESLIGVQWRKPGRQRSPPSQKVQEASIVDQARASRAAGRPGGPGSTLPFPPRLGSLAPVA
jgi:hypothetical protein